MTDNDYIAEYIKEKHPYILGLDFIIWKCGRVIRDTFSGLSSIFSGAEELEEGEQE